MHPAKSVILFTTASGAGYGLAFLLVLAHMFDYVPSVPSLAWSGFGLAFILVTGGLLSSTFHLGHPERAWRALTQWRSSWLSREGVLSILTYGPVALYAYLWVQGGLVGELRFFLGLVCLVLTAGTVYCTSMIYASLKTIHAWHTPFVPLGYAALALSSGGLLLTALLASQGFTMGLHLSVAMVLLVIAMGIKLSYWRYISASPSESTADTATGMKVRRMLEAPHTEANYLQQEMGFKIARKHAEKLRLIAHGAGFVLPVLLIAIALVWAPGLATALLWLAVILAGVGLMAERWLFFAEAKHVVTLYYGEGSA